LERVETIWGLEVGDKSTADIFCNSPAGSHLRDTGRSRSLSTRRHRRRRPVVRAPHRKTRGQKTLDVEIRRSWDTACRAAVVKTFVYMRRSESTSSTNAVRSSAVSVWCVRCARARLVCCVEAWERSLGRVDYERRVINPVCRGCAQYTDYGLSHSHP
jgi:hypothetical protein